MKEIGFIPRDIPTQYSIEVIIDFPHVLIRNRDYRTGLQYDVGYTCLADGSLGDKKYLTLRENIAEKTLVGFDYRGMLELDNPYYAENKGNLKNQIFISKEQYESLQRVYQLGFFRNEGNHSMMYGILTGKTCVSWALAALSYAGIIPAKLSYESIIFDNNSLTSTHSLVGADAIASMIKIAAIRYGSEAVEPFLNFISSGDQQIYRACEAEISNPSTGERLPTIIGECVERMKNGEKYEVSLATLDTIGDVNKKALDRAIHEVNSLDIRNQNLKMEILGIRKEMYKFKALLEIQDDREFKQRIWEGRYILYNKDGESYYVDKESGFIVTDNASADRLVWAQKQGYTDQEAIKMIKDHVAMDLR